MKKFFNKNVMKNAIKGLAKVASKPNYLTPLKTTLETACIIERPCLKSN